MKVLGTFFKVLPPPSSCMYMNHHLLKQDNFFEENKNKFLPNDDDINPNKKFIDNLFFKFFLSDKSLISKLEKYNLFWNDNDHDIIRKIFKDIVKHDLDPFPP